MDNILEKLGTIKQAEVSPFLFTRINSAIEKKKSEYVPVKWVIAASVCLIFVFVVNFKTIRSNEQEHNDLAEAFTLKTSNMLYHEQE